MHKQQLPFSATGIPFRFLIATTMMITDTIQMIAIAPTANTPPTVPISTTNRELETAAGGIIRSDSVAVRNATDCELETAEGITRSVIVCCTRN